MYEINLIGQRIVPESRKKVIMVIVALSGLALALTLMSIGFVSAANFRMISVYAGEVNQLEQDISHDYDGVPTRGELETLVRRTEPQLKEIGKLVDGRLRLAPVLERIALAVPDGLWLTRVSVADPSRIDEEAMARGRSNQFRGVVIEGVALAGRGPEGDQAVSAFVENLKNDEEFKRYTTGIEFIGTGIRQIGGTNVVGFEVTCPF